MNTENIYTVKISYYWKGSESGVDRRIVQSDNGFRGAFLKVLESDLMERIEEDADLEILSISIRKADEIH